MPDLIDFIAIRRPKAWIAFAQYAAEDSGGRTERTGASITGESPAGDTHQVPHLIAGRAPLKRHILAAKLRKKE